MAITPLPSAPLVTDDTATFNTKAFAWVDALDEFTTEANALAVEVNADATTAAQAADAADAAIGAANYKGEWSTLTGALNIPASVSHNGEVWLLTQNLGDVTANEPGVDSPNVWLNLSPAASGTYQAIASGSLSDGSPVIVNSDGTVSVISGQEQEKGSETLFDNANDEVICATYDEANNKVVIAFRDGGNSNYISCVVGEVTGTSISFGTIVVPQSNTVNGEGLIDIVYDPDEQKIVLIWANGTTNGQAAIGTVSGTSISFGSAVTFNAHRVGVLSACYDTANDKVVIAYRDTTNTTGEAIVGTVSGTSISFGAVATFNEPPQFACKIAFDQNAGKVVIVYRDIVDNFTYSIVGTVSGTSISLGTPVKITETTISKYNIVYDSTNQKVLIQMDKSLVVGTVSGTTISFGSIVEFTTDSTQDYALAYSPILNKSILTFRNSTLGGKMSYIMCEINGTDVNLSSETYEVSIGQSQDTDIVFDPDNNNFVIAYQNQTSSNRGNAFTLTPFSSNITSENYIGISAGAYTNGQTATIQTIGSVDDAQTGLTPGQAYYAKADGSLSTTPGIVSVFAGTAVSATKLIVKG